ncbi:hypothetical protein BDN72DRAFT_617138 [Pluteus cervinus]|uniref:Uncharacterized protein n=1 Tax=Pluteus cervinus TaxID=181527 RepID=A0ACD3AVK0_9AGAR|nr:hypothetical protein BDN72DRAFT_617138 [Pluteus cervinus]
MDMIPLELVEQILHHASSCLNPSDLSSTLRSFCLVSHTWDQIAQPLLFSKFIRYGRSYDQVKLHQTLLSYPHLRDLVECIWVDIGISSSSHWVTSNTTDSNLDSESTLDLYRQLTRNPRFHHIVIKNVNPSEAKPRAQEILSSLISSANVTVLSCYRLSRYPIDLFYHCISVRELHLYQSRFSGFERIGVGSLEGVQEGVARRLDENGTHQDLSSSRRRRRPTLLYLYLEALQGDEDILKWFLHPNCAFDISELKTLDFYDDSCESDSFQRVQEIVARTSSSLEEVGLHPPVYLSEVLINVDYTTLASLPQLKCLKISLSGDENFWPWAIQLLSSLSHPEHIEELQVSYTLGPSGSEPLLSDVQAQGWEGLDLCLTAFAPSSAACPTTHRKFLNLKRVVIGLAICEWTTDGKSRSRRLAEAFPVILPRISALIPIKVSFSNVSGFIHNSDCWYIEGIHHSN